MTGRTTTICRTRGPNAPGAILSGSRSRPRTPRQASPKGASTIRRHVVVPLVVVLLLLVATVPAAARDQMALGISNPKGTGNTAAIESALDAFVGRNDGIEPAIWSVWSQWGSRGTKSDCQPGHGTCYFPTDTLQMLHDRGIQGMVWWEPINPAKPGLAKYARHKKTYIGKIHDSYIKKWAQEAKAFGQANDTKVLLRMAHEANGTWFPWVVGNRDNTPKTFRKFWRYVWNKFKAQGALPYVDFVWSVTNKSCKGCNPYSKIHPGKPYYKYAGLTAFNWGAQRSWKPMVKQLEKPMKQLWQVAGNKPVIVAELASHFRPTSKSKAAWIKNGYNKSFRKWSRIKAVMYLDTDQPKKQWGHPDWRLSKPNDGSAQAAYAEMSARWKFKGSLVD
jgi:hypothetical protein